MGANAPIAASCDLTACHFFVDTGQYNKLRVRLGFHRNFPHLRIAFEKGEVMVVYTTGAFDADLQELAHKITEMGRRSDEQIAAARRGTLPKPRIRKSTPSTRTIVLFPRRGEGRELGLLTYCQKGHRVARGRPSRESRQIAPDLHSEI